jgi:WD40 repeat protein
MAWPLSQDYNEAVQSPGISFADPDLRAGQPVLNALGMPLPRSGNFADVYEFRGAGGARWAVKCFTREVRGLRERYSEISRYLGRAKLPFTVDFQYLEQGIRIRGAWYPVLKMHWVEGLLLNEFVRDSLGKLALLDGLAQIWLRMGQRLREASVAHADLQHGNVILVPGSRASALAVKLIDYDGMWVPALARTPSGEAGHPAYQHPKRLAQGIYSAEVDRLPLLAVTCALRAVAVAGKALWERYDNGDNLLFRQADLLSPSESGLFKELWQVPDGAVHDLVGHLALAVTGPLAETPLAHDVMSDSQTRPLTAVEERRVTALLGTGAWVRRTTAAGSAVAQPVMAAPARANGPTSEARPVPQAAADVWQGLAEEEGLTRPKGKVRSKAPLVWVASAGGILAVLGAAVGALVLATRDNSAPQSTEHLGTRPPPAERISPIPHPEPKAHVSPTQRPQDKEPARSTKSGVRIELSDVGRAAGPRVDNHPPLDRFDYANVAPEDRFGPFGNALVGSMNYRFAHVSDGVFSSDGRYFAVTCNGAHVILLWDLARPTKPVARWTAERPSNVTFSADGSRLAFATAKRFQVWTVPLPKKLEPFCDVPLPHCTYSGSEASRVAYAPDQKTVAVATACQVLLVDLQKDPPETSVLQGHEGYVPQIAYSADGAILACTGPGGLVLWDVKARQGKQIRARKKVGALAFAPTGRTLAWGDGPTDGAVHVWDVGGAEPKERWSNKAHTGAVTAVCFAPNGQSLVSAEGGSAAPGSCRAVWWNVLDCSVRRIWQLPERCNTAAFAPGPYLALGCQNHKVYILRLKERPVLANREKTQAPGKAQPNLRWLTVSHDGGYVLSGGGTVAELWELPSLKFVRRFPHPGVINGADFSPDGRRLLTAGGNSYTIGPSQQRKFDHCTMRLWDVASGRETRHFNHPSPVHCVAFAPDGKRALSGSGSIFAVKGQQRPDFVDCLMRWWNVETDEILNSFSDPKGPVTKVAFCAGGRRALSLGGQVAFWDLNTGKLEYSHPKLGYVGGVFAEGGGVNLGGHEVVVWDKQGKEVHRISLSSTDVLRCIAVTPNGRLGLVGCGDIVHKDGKPVRRNGRFQQVNCVVHLCDLRQGRDLARLTGHEQIITAVALSPDGRFAVSGEWMGKMKIWDLAKYLPRGEAAVKGKKTGREPDAAQARAKAAPKAVVVKKNLLIFDTGSFWINSMSVALGDRYALITGGHEAFLFNLRTRRKVNGFSNRPGYVYCAAFSPKGTQFLLGTTEMEKDDQGVLRESGGTLRYGALAGLGKPKVLEDDSPIRAVAFSPDARRALAGKRKGVSLWDLRAGKRLKEFDVPGGEIKSVAFSPDGRRGYAASQLKVHCWDLESGDELTSFPKRANAASFSRDAARVLGAVGQQVELHDRDGNLLHTFGPFEGWVQSLAVSADGRWGLVGGGDYLKEDGQYVKRDGQFLIPAHCTVRLLDLDDGRERARFEGHANHVSSVAFTPDGRFALSASNRGKVRLWDLKSFRPAAKKVSQRGAIRPAGKGGKGSK